MALEQVQCLGAPCMIMCLSMPLQPSRVIGFNGHGDFMCVCVCVREWRVSALKNFKNKNGPKSALRQGTDTVIKED